MMNFVPDIFEDARPNVWKGFRSFLYRVMIPRLLPASREVKRVACPRCQGKGEQLMKQKTLASEFIHTRICPKCLGDGEIYVIGNK